MYLCVTCVHTTGRGWLLDRSCLVRYGSSTGTDMRSATNLRLCSSPTLPKSAATRLRRRLEVARLTLSRSKTGSSSSRPCTSPDRRATRRVGSYITYSTAVTWVAAGLSVLRNGSVSSIGSAALLLPLSALSRYHRCVLCCCLCACMML